MGRYEWSGLLAAEGLGGDAYAPTEERAGPDLQAHPGAR